MIETYFGLGNLSTPQAYFISLLIGLLSGFVLERAGFGSSRRLAGIFYLRDMAVLKVMFSALITAMLGLSALLALGWIEPDQLYFMPTIYGAQIIGGLLFGIGFVMSAWCPGTGAVGLASGKLDALIFLFGVGTGSILFNELFTAVKPLYDWGQSGVVFVYEGLGMSRMSFAFLFTALAVACFWGAEYVEKRGNGVSVYFKTPFLRAFSLGLMIFAGGLFILPSAQDSSATMAQSSEAEQSIADAAANGLDQNLLARIDGGLDHIQPEELANRLMHGDPDLILVDIRTSEEFRRFHLPGALHIQLPDLIEKLAPHKNKGIIVLYSNGMTHPAQASDALYRIGFRNVYFLTDGLQGFLKTCLKPVSLRPELVPAEIADRIKAWRDFFYNRANTPVESGNVSAEFASGITDSFSLPGDPPGLVDTAWLEVNLARRGLKVLDLRTQPEYNTGHIPGSMFVSTETFRGVVNGVPSMLLPAEMLAMQMSQMGIDPTDAVVLVPGDAVRDATLVGMALERLGHTHYAVLDGGMGKWIRDNLPIDNTLPAVRRSDYPLNGKSADDFTVNYQDVLGYLKQSNTVILDVRPTDYYIGKKSDEARAGHIPGAVNRSYSEDIVEQDGYHKLRPRDQLASAYAALIPSKDTRVIIHCRTGHQASQTYFVLKHMLGYSNVLYYDAGWTEWAARPELPVSMTAPVQ